MAASPGRVLGLSDSYRAWVADNLVRGASPVALIAALRKRGVAAALARREVVDIASSPWLETSRRLARRVAQLEMVTRLSRELACVAGPPRVERRAAPPSRAEFFERYYAAQRPVVLAGLCARWRATSRWGPEYFKRRFGRALVRVCTGRNADAECDRNFEAHTERMRLAQFVDRVVSSGATNDFYMISNNRNLEGALAPLLADVAMPRAYLDPAKVRGCVSLWFGPAGTATPLHHDNSNILFCQIVGRKRVRLVPPFETALLDGARGFYAAAADPAAQRWAAEVELAPGDALFLPVGWWHEVRSLDVSASLSFTNFVRSNAFTWYAPGARPPPLPQPGQSSR